MNDLKQCSKCKEWKPRADFPKGDHKDGYRSACKKCHNAANAVYHQDGRNSIYQQRYRQKAGDKFRAYFRTEEYKIKRKDYRQKEQAKLAKNANSKRYYEKYPDKAKARRMVNIAIRDGKFPCASSQKCELCNAQALEYHHYKGYEKEHWFDVQPLCKRCHTDVTISLLPPRLTNPTQR